MSDHFHSTRLTSSDAEEAVCAKLDRAHEALATCSRETPRLSPDNDVGFCFFKVCTLFTASIKSL